MNLIGRISKSLFQIKISFFLSTVFGMTVLSETQEIQNKIDDIYHIIEKDTSNNSFEIIELSDIGIELSKEINDSLSLAKFLLEKCYAFQNIEKIDSAQNVSKQLLKIALKINDEHTICRSYNLIGSTNQELGHFDEAITNYEKAIKYCEASKDNYGIWFALNNKATSYLRQGCYTNAIPILDNIIKNEKLSEELRIKSVLNKSAAFNYSGKTLEAIEQLIKVKNFGLKNNNKAIILNANEHIGTLLENYGIYEYAKVYYESNLDYVDKRSNHHGHLCSSLGQVCLKLDSIDLARNYYHKSIEILKNNKSFVYGHAIIGLGNIALKEKKIKVAKNYYNDAKKVFQAIDNYSGLAYLELKLARNEVLSRNYARADSLAQLALKFYEKSEMYNHLIENYELLIDIYQETGKDKLREITKLKLNELLDSTIGPRIVAETTKTLIYNILKNDSSINPNKGIKETSPSLNIKHILISILIIFGLSILYFMRSNHNQSKNNIKTERQLTLKKNEADILLEKLSSYMQKDEVYKNPNLTLSDLAKQIKTTDKKLSELLNIHLKTNFYNYLNKYRIELFAKKIASNQHLNFSIIGLAQQCGFKSKTSFYRNFKKEKGVLPKEYIKNQTSNQ